MESLSRENIIIVGAGVAGLKAARELSKKGYGVTVLEANNRLGGRIHTWHNSSFERPVERGVEFIHGNLPLTLELLKEAKIEYRPVRGRMIRIENGEWKTQDDLAVGWKELMERMNEVQEDITLNEFLKENFKDGVYASLRKSALRFAEGFDLADPAIASVLALRAEWMEEQDEQYHVPAGFDKLVDHLEKQCRSCGTMIRTSSPVKKIKWQKNAVTVITRDEQEIAGSKIIITVSLGVLRAEPSAEASISFYPSIDNYIAAANKIGFGSAVKIVLQFRESFWEKEKKNLGFLFSEEIVPTWWTQLPIHHHLLTGWAGGPQAEELQQKSDKEVFQLGLGSLSSIFKKSRSELEGMLTASLVANWKQEVFCKGAYSFNTLETPTARTLLNEPVEDTLFFAGEALYNGSSPGTVEAALVSGKSVAEKIMTTAV